MKGLKTIALIALGSMVAFNACGSYAYTPKESFKEVVWENPTVEVEDKDFSKEAYNGTGIPDEIPQEVLDQYLKYMEPANDKHDFRYASDYELYDLVQLEKAYDSCGYQKIFGYADASLEDIEAALKRNPNISEKYKGFIREFATDLRRLYPNVNLAVLRHNLETLKIDEMTQAGIKKETLSMDSAACYLRSENRICVLENLNLSKESDDYIVLVHELCHAARSVSKTVGNEKLTVGFYEFYKMGPYAEEAMITNLAYELQGLGEKATFYPMQSSYYRIICDCIGYTAEDFFNHSVNYLIEKMDDYMGDEQYAYQIVAMIDAQSSLRYTPYQSVDFHDFLPMHEYIARMYFKTYLTPEMTEEEAKEVFDRFYEDITFNFENMNRKYTIDENTFLPVFQEMLVEYEIQNL